MHDRGFDAKQVGIEVAFRGPVANLPGKADIELVLGDRVKLGAVFVGTGRLRVKRPGSSFPSPQKPYRLFPMANDSKVHQKG